MKVYVASIITTHTDAYEMEDDGTTILGIYEKQEDAVRKITDLYEEDRIDLLEGSCSANGGYEFNEDETCEVGEWGDDYCASICVQYKKTGELDRRYEYYVKAYELQ